MFTKKINFKNFIIKKFNKEISKDLNLILKEKNKVIESLSTFYKYSYNKKIISKIKKYKDVRVIGMGGSILGTEAIYDFLREKIKKNFYFINNLQSSTKISKKKYINLIVSKSGNTLETISNANILIKKNEKNFFITENKNSYLYSIANKLKSEIIHHNNFIGGRYSVLSEVGMLPAQLMGLDEKKFKQLNSLIINKNFIRSLVSNVSSILYFIKKKKSNSVILNYDERSDNFFKWYQQLMAESLGKKGKGILPIISTMPKDNHSLMQLYLDGPKNNFYTFFFTHEKNSMHVKSNDILFSHKYLKNKSLNQIILSQKKATEKVFIKKNIPFRSFEVMQRDEKTLGELFCFFILETILLGRALKVNPYDQPSVELIKKETKKILI
ncbi:glucose-6-phosphate isomerase [Candidatus Pelagibacter sp.]|nr:glucose-6-phosphate isomerase [Candidatus Pelagibacter bacterium]MDC0364151.1 glucose-6-phosphate isomerase [Candidatus Pelagibacter sp.]